MGIRCFWLEETDKVRRYFRRWHECTIQGSYARGKVPLDEIEIPAGEMLPAQDHRPHLGDHRWPKACECGHEYVDTDQWQIFQERVYARTDTGEVMVLRDAPVGAMWDAWWMSDWCKGDDGRCLVVRCPQNGHEWMIDSRASNCTMQDDHVHHCWLRSGEPPLITVSKEGGFTCSAGGGSIQTPTWHGFLRNGELVDC